MRKMQNMAVFRVAQAMCSSAIPYTLCMQSILTSAADSRGEWHLPLTAEALGAMETVMDANADDVNEALLSYAYAWLRKAHDDKIPGECVWLTAFGVSSAPYWYTHAYDR